MENNFAHIPVLLDEVIANFQIKPEGIYVDCTVGLGGHAFFILEKLTTGQLVCIDKDSQALELARHKLMTLGNRNVTFIHDDFGNLKTHLEKLGIQQVDGILVDLGVSSMQLDDPDRGFSYQQDAPLDMRMDQNAPLTAHDIINRASAAELEDLIFEGTQSQFSRKVARAIVANRPLQTTFDLNAVLRDALPGYIVRKKHPGKTFFQAFRMAVNNEIGTLEQSLPVLAASLRPQGVLQVITFHSLEDKIVKNFYRQLTYQVPNRLPVMVTRTFLQKQAKPKATEVQNNKRARSAKLRVLIKL